MASALKKLLNSHVHFRRSVSVEEQRAENTTDSYEEDRLRIRSTSIFVQPKHTKRYKDSQTYSIYVYRMMVSKISTYDGIK